jgi:glycine/D-amino acid oxidase-like deaminating enzyme
VLAGNIHLGKAMQRLSDTLVPVWRHAAVTGPLGERLTEAVTFHGSVIDTDGIDHFRIVGGDRLIWASPETTWNARSEGQAAAIRRRIRTIFPQLGAVEIATMFSGAIGQTVHGMPQIGRLSPGLWVASGFGRQGLNTSAMAGQLIAGGMLEGDDRWRLFSPFELVWAGGTTGRAAGYAIGLAERARSAAAGTLARYREQARIRARAREANRLAGTRPPRSAARRAPPDQEGA